MQNNPIDVVGIGNAIVDVLAQASDDFLREQGQAKGSMALIDTDTADRLYGQLQKLPGGCLERSGGSAGNTMAGLSSLGARGAYIGKVANDALGQAFTRDMLKSGTSFDCRPLVSGAPTARCMIMVTPDAQRTMATYLGACVELGPEDVDDALIGKASVTYLEGYLWDKPRAKEAFIKAARLAHEAGRKVALSLSDSFCVDRHRTEFQDLVANHVDILFANESEILSLYQRDTFEQAVAHASEHCEVAAVTRSEKGSVVIAGREIHEVPAAPLAQLVDTTGAGDLYAAGFLFGFTRSRNLVDCARIGALAAAEVISHYGARPEVRLADWVGARM
jgi:sugar/nucleoside kinase (ribokinase family)